MTAGKKLPAVRRTAKGSQITMTENDELLSLPKGCCVRDSDGKKGSVTVYMLIKERSIELYHHENDNRGVFFGNIN